MLDALLHSTAGGSDSPDLATLHPINLVQLIAPYMPIDRAFGGSAHELSLSGRVPLMLTLWVFSRRGELGGLRRLAQATAAFAMLAIALAMGSGLFRAPHSALWSAWFHFSCRYTVLFQLAVSVLAAIGFVLVEREARERGKIQRLVPLPKARTGQGLVAAYEVLGGTVLVSVAVAVAGLILQAGHQVASPRGCSWARCLWPPPRCSVIAASQGVRGAIVGLVLFMAADLGYYGLSCTLDDSSARPDDFIAQSVAPPVEHDTSGGGVQPRIAPPAYNNDAAPIGNQMTLSGWQRIDGCAATEAAQIVRLFPACRAAGVVARAGSIAVPRRRASTA